MSIAYCEYCNEYIDLDYNCEHFDENGDCEAQLEGEEEEEED